MKPLKEYKKMAIHQYEDLRDTIAVIEAMQLEDHRQGVPWEIFKKKLRAKNN